MAGVRMRLPIQNRWLPWEKRWEWDSGMIIDVGTTAMPEARFCGVTITNAGADFVEFDMPDEVRVEAGSIKP